MHRLFPTCFIICLGMALGSGCGRKEPPGPTPVPAPAPPAATPLNFSDAELTPDGIVTVKSTGQPFTGTLHEFWDSGELRRETQMEAGLRHGWIKEYFSNGKLRATGQCVEGQVDGDYVTFAEDGYSKTIITYKLGEQTGRRVEETELFKNEVRAGKQAEQQNNATVWKPEVESQERERTFVKLWDDLRAGGHDWRPLEQFIFKKLTFGELGETHSHDWSIKRREMSGAGNSVDMAGWQALIQGWKDRSIKLIETEWHQASYEQGKDGAPSSSVFKAMGHLFDEPNDTRHIVRFSLRVHWSEEPIKGLYLPEDLAIEKLTLLSRTGETPLVTQEIINVLKDNPEVKPEQSDTINLWGRVYPPTLAVQDLNGDHLPEIITGGGNLIYWNRGDFSFQPEILVPGNNGLNHALVFADFTGDGHLDFLTLNPRKQPEVVPGNGKGKFNIEAGIESPLAGQLDNWSCLAVGDVDQDGDLDVYACQYKPAYKNGTMPIPYYDANDGHPAFLLLNDGKGKFTDGTEAAGLGEKRYRRTYSASLVDLDNDRDLDLMVVSDFAGLDLFYNDGKGKFTDRTEQLGEHRFSFGMAHSVADFDGDGQLDIYMVGMGSTTARRLEGMKLGRKGFEDVQDARMKMGYGNRLFLGDGKGGYKQAPYNDVVARSGWSWGCTPWDFDLDGDRDLFVANGHLSGKSCRDYCSTYWTTGVYDVKAIKENPVQDMLFRDRLKSLMDGNISWNGFEHNVLFMNEGQGKYTNVSYLMGVSHESDCRSVISADMDHDGRPDLLVVEGRRRTGDQQREGYIQLIRNRHQTGNHWIGAHLEGAPVGAVVTVVQGDKRQVLPLVTGDSFDSQHPYTAHFGLGKNANVDSLEVRWPNGKTTTLDKPESGKYHVLRH